MPPTAAADDQLQLIDTTHPASKKFRTARGALNRHRAEQHAAKKKADDKENEILAIIRDDMGVRAGADGVLRFRMDGQVVTIKPGKAQLKIEDLDEVSKATADDEAEEADEDKTEPPPAPTRRGRAQ